MTDILLPKLGMSMTEAILTEWLIPDGGEVSVGQDLYAIETDKSVQEVQSPAAGTLRIVVPAGDTHPVGTLLGRIE